MHCNLWKSHFRILYIAWLWFFDLVEKIPEGRKTTIIAKITLTFAEKKQLAISVSLLNFPPFFMHFYLLPVMLRGFCRRSKKQTQLIKVWRQDVIDMSFLDFCFVLFLLWIVIFVILLFYLDGDLSLMWHAKFGRKICKYKSTSKFVDIPAYWSPFNLTIFSLYWSCQ